MRGTWIVVLAVGIALAGCATPTTQRYAVSADNSKAIKAINANGVAFGEFAAPAEFTVTCKPFGPLQVADGLSHTAYIRKAFEDEFRAAGAMAPPGTAARIVLTGRVTKLEFSSTPGSTDRSWTIGLTLRSSNGNELGVSESYAFDRGASEMEACRHTADAFLRAVQGLVGKAVRTPHFESLLR